MRWLLFLVVVAPVVGLGDARADCERLLGVRAPPLADLLLDRPTIENARYAGRAGPGADDAEPCTVGVDLSIAVPSAAELDWLDIVLTRSLEGNTELASSGCAIIADGRAQLRVRLIPGQRYLATVAAYDVEGRKSEPVSLELVSPGVSSREWLQKAPQCPKPPTAPAAPAVAKRSTWPAGIAVVASAFSLAWVLYLLAWPRSRRR